MRNKEDRLGVDTKLNQPEDLPVNNKQDLQLNFIVPTEVIDLPSEGKFYPIDHPLHGKDTLEIKEMTAKEEDILTSKTLLKKGLALDKLIQSVLVDKNINPDTLTLSDRNAIIINSRISGYGPEYLTEFTCPNCLERIKYKFNLLNAKQKEYDEDFCKEVNENGFFEYELPSTKWKVICKALSGMDEKTIARSMEIKKKNNTLNDSMLFDQLRCMTVSIQGVLDRQIIEKALNALPAKDSKYMRKVYQNTVKDVNMVQAFICTKCDHEADVEVPLSADFFWFE